jgi:hypothetical protein
MTLLVALVDDAGGLVVAADGQESSDDGQSWGSEPREKFHPLGGGHLMWGWAGTSHVGLPFGDWLRGDAPMGTWEALKEAAAAKFRDLSKGQENQGAGNAAIVAGYLDGQLGILRADHTGLADLRQTRIFEGINKWAAQWGWEYAVSLQGNTPETLYHWLTHMISPGRALGLGLPVYVWRCGGAGETFHRLEFA